VNPYNPYLPQAQSHGDPRVRRALREQAVAYAGPQSRPFVEKYGDTAVAALGACSPSGAQKLVEWHAAGALDRLPRPVDLLGVVARHGDDAVLWAIQPEHSQALIDVDNFNAFCLNPLEIALALKPLEQCATEARTMRLTAAAQQNYSLWQYVKDNPAGVAVAGVLCVALLLWWRKRQSA
jgi:hypothetical protein